MSHIGEIILSNSIGFHAAANKTDTLGAAPVQLGQLIKTEVKENYTVYGLVSHIEHNPIDTSRKIMPLGMSQEKLQREMPQVFELIQTVFQVIHVGFKNEGGICQGLPLQPPYLHHFVLETSQDEQREFFQNSPVFIRLIINAKLLNPDELIVAFLQQHKSLLNHDSLVKMGKELSYFFSDDHRRLESLLERL